MSSLHALTATKEIDMADSTEFKGRVKEAAGDLTDDKDLQKEGKTDQTAGKLKDKIDDAADKVKDLIHHDKDKS
jgi:uncharacterized protein YjbJ (UPF0337 family)